MEIKLKNSNINSGPEGKDSVSSIVQNEEPTFLKTFSNLSLNVPNNYKISTMKLLYDSTSSKNKHSLHSLIMKLEETKFGCSRMHLDVYIFIQKRSPTLWDIKEHINRIQWKHGRLTVEYIYKLQTMEWISYVWNPWKTDSELVAILDARYIDVLPTNWYQYLNFTKNQLANRSDIIGYTGYWNLKEDETRAFLKTDIAKSSSLILQQGISSAGIFIPHSPERWRCFLSWLQRNRMDWYLWPTLLDVKSRGDQKWADFNSTIIGSWQHWLSRFAKRFDLYIARPPVYFDGNILELHSNNEMPSFNATDIIMASANGSSFTENAFSRIPTDHITKLVEMSQRTGGVLSITVITEAFLETALSWLCNVDAGGFRPPGIVWITADIETYNTLNVITDTHAIHIEDMQGGKSNSGFGTPGYWLLMLERVYIVRDILERGCTVFLFETDQVWLRDPIPYLDRILNEGRSIDLVGTLDGTKEIAGNFLLFRPTLTMRKVYREVSRLFELEYNRKIVVRPAQYSKIPNSKLYINNDQSILSKLVLYDVKFRVQFPITLRLLDTDLFVCGKWYDGLNGPYSSARSRSPIIINNNFVSGIEKKTARLKRFGHWFIKNGSCNTRMVRTAMDENKIRSVSSGVHQEAMTTIRPASSRFYDNEILDGGDVEAHPGIVWSALDKEHI